MGDEVKKKGNRETREDREREGWREKAGRKRYVARQNWQDSGKDTDVKVMGLVV